MEAPDKSDAREFCGPNDERMSWGLHFYEQQDRVNRAHFPEIFDSKDGRPTIEDGDDSEIVSWR